MTNDDNKKTSPTPTPEYKGLFVATPCYDTLMLDYVKSILDLQKEFFINKIQITFQMMKSSLVTQGRNLCVSGFLNSTAESMCFIDSDISFSVRSIIRLMNSPYEVCLVPYPMKTLDAHKFVKDNERRPSDHPDTKGSIFPIELPDAGEIHVKNGFCEIKRGPAGCMMIKRSALEKMIKHYPELTILQKTLINGEMINRPHYYNFFDTHWDIKTKTYSGEDFNFCKLWRDMGGKIFALVDEEISHVGQKLYRGKLMHEFITLGPEEPLKMDKPPTNPVKG